MSSNHHNDFNYTVLSDDIIRFADMHNLEKFTVLGNSIGGKIAMYVACRFPDRADSCISMDAAPIDDSKEKKVGEFTFNVVLIIFFFLCKYS